MARPLKKKSNKVARATRLEVAERIEFAAKKLLQGWRPPDVVRKVQTEFAICERQAADYVGRAQDQIIEIGKRRIENSLEQAIASREELLRLAFTADDLQLALSILKDEAELLGLYAPEKLDIQVTQLDRAIERELERLAGASETSAAPTSEGEEQ